MDNQLAVIGNHIHPIWFTNSSDLAELVHNAIGNDAAKNMEFAVQDQQAVTYTEAAKEFLASFAPEAEVYELPMDALDEMGLPEEQAVFIEHVLTFVQQLREEQVDRETRGILGAPKHTITSFAEELRNTSSKIRTCESSSNLCHREKLCLRMHQHLLQMKFLSCSA